MFCVQKILEIRTKAWKDGNCFHTYSYNCNMMMHEKLVQILEHTLIKRFFSRF